MSNINKVFLKFLVIIFCILSVIHVCYGMYTHRGLYLDGSFLLVVLLNNLSLADKMPFAFDENHPRFFVLYLQEFPVVISYYLFHIKNKLILSHIYSFSLFIWPLLFFFWNYKLTERTKQYGILFWNIFTYCVINLLYSIWCCVETIIGSQLYYLLLNYLLGDIRYNKWDKFGIAFLLIMMFGIYEHTIIIGLLFFAAMLYIVFKEKNRSFVKISIGIFSMFASLYTLIFCLSNESEHSDFYKFLVESTDFWRISKELCIIVSFITLVALLCIFLMKKNKELNFLSPILIFIYGYTFYQMLYYKDIFLNPSTEGHMKSLACFADVLIIFGIIIYRFLKYPSVSIDIVKKCLIPVLLCGITLTAWQLVHTYYWDKNIKYFISELKNCPDAIYVPEQHEEISGFKNKNLRRYIWHCDYITTAIILVDEYKIKTLPTHFLKEQEIGNITYSDKLYPILDKNLLSVPYTILIEIKNVFWDLSDFANELDKYQKENNKKSCL